MYADDTQILASYQLDDQQSAASMLQSDLMALELWMVKNHLTINTDTTQIITFVSWLRVRCHGEKTQLSSGWTLIRSELSSPNFKSLVRTERSFAIRYPNVLIKPFAVTLIFAYTTRLTPTFSCGILIACFRLQIATKSERCFFRSCS